MSYLDIVNLIFSIVGAVLFLVTCHVVVFQIVGLFKYKKFPKTDEKLKYGIVIAARNEGNVIADLIESVYKSNYPQDKVKVFVIAHNCTDKTAEISRDHGAIVYEYNNPAERTKGYALRQLFKEISRDFGIESLDGYIVFDADNVLKKDFLSKMNDAFVACGKDRCVTSFRCAKNFGQNTMAANYGLLYAVSCCLESSGRSALNCTAKIYGSGVLIPSAELKNGWNTVIIAEDTDFTVQQVLKGKNVEYCNEAVYYDEQPTTFKVMLRQRLRWAKGGLQIFKSRFGMMLAGIFRKKLRGGESLSRFSIFNMLVYLTPYALVGFFLFVLNMILISFCPLAGLPAAQVWTNWLISTAIGAVLGYAGLMLLPIAIYIKERKRIGKVPFWVKIKSILTYPIFMMMDIFFQICALFVRNLVWKPIKHSETVSDLKAAGMIADEEMKSVEVQ